jgi:hypothetical protein
VKALSGRYLSFAEREEIALLRAGGRGMREIARRLGRAPSTISRELRRNAATRSGGLEYRATTAQWHADRSARRPKPAKLAVNARLRDYVQDRLVGRIVAPDGKEARGPSVAWTGRRAGRRQDRRWAKAWSPEQIVGRLRHDFPKDETMRVSHEAIYQSLFVQGRGALKRELTACLRTGRAVRLPQSRLRGRGKSFVTREVMISERPAEAALQPLRDRCPALAANFQQKVLLKPRDGKVDAVGSPRSGAHRGTKVDGPCKGALHRHDQGFPPPTRVVRVCPRRGGEHPIQHAHGRKIAWPHAEKDRGRWIVFGGVKSEAVLRARRRPKQLVGRRQQGFPPGNGGGHRRCVRLRWLWPALGQIGMADDTLNDGDAATLYGREAR